jgi:hypothetical protein
MSIFTTDVKWKPINAQACRVLWKAPWWAHHNEITKEAEKVFPKHEWELHANLFNGPPIKGIQGQETIDRRGVRVRFKLESKEGVITGHYRRSGNGHAKLQQWWVMLEDGGITTLTWGVNKKAIRYEVLNQP